MKKTFRKLNRKGQSTLEYAMLIAIMMAFFIILVNFFKESGIGAKIAGPINESFKSSYQFGNPNVKGFDDRGGPENHPRAANNNKNFRIFIYRK